MGGGVEGGGGGGVGGLGGPQQWGLQTRMEFTCGSQ